MGCTGCTFNNTKLSSYDWLKDLPDTSNETNIIEVQFKNTRKEFYTNDAGIILKRGDMVAVESSPGHDIGMVTLTGRLALLQIKKKGLDKKNIEYPKVYRKARESDLEKLKKSRNKEKQTMIRSRQIARDLGLDMKIGDVEYQGDGTKAIFYYIAEDRVDFRELIKHYAREFSIRVEMKQIGARQEAGMIGGIGSCGRELCCSSWRTNFTSVSTNAARYQELPVNAQKLAGQCGKLKCCLMYELDAYLDAREEFPKELLELETKKGIAHHFKTDVFKRTLWYSFSREGAIDFTPVSLDRVKEVIMLNKKGVKVDELSDIKAEVKEVADSITIGNTNTEDINRFDKKKPNKKRKNRNKRHKFSDKKNPKQ
jgi:cell fate regulator YaaT (PSP1 superfamily)